MAMKQPAPWNLEAYRYYYSENADEHLLLNKPIREFLENDDKFYLIGSKGLGKTLFLRYKSYLYHEKYGESIKFNVSQTELTENLNIHPDTFTKEELFQFKEEELWCLIWELALWILVFRIIKAPIPANLERLTDNADQLSTILTRLLNNRSKIEEYNKFVSDFQEQKSKIQSGIAIFIDDVDQNLRAFLKNPHYTDDYYEGKLSPSVEIWVNAQMGLIGAIYHINRQNAHIKIFATVRREAFEAYTGDMKINYRQHASILHYEKDELRIIFEKNIQLIKRAELIDPATQSLVGKFLGFDQMPHRFAVDIEGKRRNEDAFDFIYRHSFGRPREIILIGSELHTLVSSHAYRKMSEEDRIAKIRILVNKQSHELLLQYKQEIIPYLDEQEMLQFIEQVRGNVITKEERLRLNLPTLQRYFNLGLIGYTRSKNHVGMMRQEFKTPATYNYRAYQSLPETDYLLIHSALDTTLLEKHSFGHFYNEFNIIGDGYDFYPIVESPIYRIEYYLPRDISGNRMKSGNESAGHAFPLEQIYTEFFQFDDHPTRYEQLMTHQKAAGQVLVLLGRICFCYILEKKFKTGYYQHKQEFYRKELSRYNFVRRYNAELPDARPDIALNRFLDKIIGRFIALGAYLVLDMRIEWIHGLLLSGKFKFEREEKNQSAFTYINRSFFIRELRREEPRNPNSPADRQLKQRIFNYLSKHEQEGIRTFVCDASDEVNYIDWLEQPAHKEWLETHVLSSLWRPE